MPTNTSNRETRVTLAWPDSGLSPNARLHWAMKARLVRGARKASWASVLAIPPGKRPRLNGSAHLQMVFCPPDKRRRDRDNLIASMKAATDGISDALGIDDSRFTTTYSIGEPVKGGAVHVTIRGA